MWRYCTGARLLRANRAASSGVKGVSPYVPTAHVHRDAGEVGGLPGGQERRRFGDVEGIGDPTEGIPGYVLGFELVYPRLRVQVRERGLGERATRSVATRPGHRTLTVMPAGASSWASAWVKPITANLEAL